MCKHPPRSVITGWYKNQKGMDHLWAACAKCGTVLREAPAYKREEREWNRQKGRT